MPTIRECTNRGFQQQAERLRAAMAALLTPIAAHNFVPRSVGDVAVYRLDRRSLLVCLSAGHCGAGDSFWLQTSGLSRGVPKRFPFGAQTQIGSHPLPNATDESVSKGVKLFFGAV